MAMSAAPTVLVGFGDAYAAIEAVWSLQRAGMRVAAFTRRGARSALRRVPGVELVEIASPAWSASASREELARLLRRLRPDAVLPLDDAALWLVCRADLGGAALAGPDPDGTALALDKDRQLTAAAAAGLTVPPTDLVRVAGAAARASWPIVLKPADAVRIVDDRLVRPRGAVCAGPDELASAEEGLGGGVLLRQPLLHGTGEGVFGYVDERGPTELSAHRRVRMVNPQGSASSACRSVDVDPQLIAPIRQLLAGVGWTGLFMVEFLRDGAGIPWFMELNGRAWGSLALARRRGFEYPAWAVQFALGLPRSPEPPDRPRTITARHLGRELSHLLFVLRGPQSRAITQWPSRWRTAAELLAIRRDDRLYNWDPRQPLVLASDTVDSLAGLAAGRRRRR
jgi:hypothetical protein